MGQGNASKGLEKVVLYAFAIAVWLVNALTISMQGGGFFGEITPDMDMSVEKVLLMILQIIIQVSPT